MVSALNSSDNKRHITLAAIGGAAWGAKEGYNTVTNIHNSKESYKNIMKGFYYTTKPGSIRDLFEEDLRSLGLSEKEISKSADSYMKGRKQDVEKLKKNCRNEVKKIKKSAPLKITAKTFGGAAIGFGLSDLISYIKSDK